MVCSDKSRSALAWGLIAALGLVAFALRGQGAHWWAAKGGDAAGGALAGWVVLDVVAAAAVWLALGRTARADRWPVRALLLASVLVMQPVAHLLTFGFRDSELGLGWVAVELAVLGVVLVLEVGRPRVAVPVAVACGATAAFAASLLAVTPACSW